MNKILSTTILLGVLAFAGCGKSEKSGDKAGGGGGAAVTGGCINETAGDCWEHPAGGDATVLADICDNDPGAKWVASCPSDKRVGGCKSANKYDKGAPAHWFYKGTVDDVKKTCADGGDTFVAN